MLLRRVRRTQAAARERLDELHDEHREMEEGLIGIFGQVLDVAGEGVVVATADSVSTDDVLARHAAFGREVRQLLAERGGVEALAEQCRAVSAWHRGNDLPLLWSIHAKHRILLFRLLDLLDIRSATHDRSLLDALASVSQHRHAHRDEMAASLDLGFASQRWQTFVAKRHRSGPGVLDRRALEMCVFVHLAGALEVGDIFVEGAEAFADYRTQLLPWAECEVRLLAYGAAFGIPERGEDFPAALRAELAALAAKVDARFPDNAELSLDADGTPHLKQLTAAEQPAGLAAFEGEAQARMPEWHMLDVLRGCLETFPA